MTQRTEWLMPPPSVLHYLIFPVLLALALLCAADLPRLLAFGPGVAAVFFTAWAFFIRDGHSFRPGKPLAGIILSILILSGLSAAWSVAPDVSLERTGKLAAVLIPGGLLIHLGLTADMKKFAPFLWILPAAVCAAALLIVLELTLDAPFYRLVRSMDGAQRVKNHVFNRGAITVTLCFFPALAILNRYAPTKWMAGAFILAFAAMLAAIESQSAQLAALLGMLALAAFPHSRKKAWYGLMGLYAILMLAAPFISIWAFRHLTPGLEHMPFLGRGGGFAGQRMEIWDYVSRYLLDRPFTGFGMEATRTIKDFDSAQIYQGGTSILHPHNFALQLWMEFGVVGAAAGIAFGVYLLRLMQTKLTPVQTRIALPTLVAALSAASTSYGLWQSWWVGLLCLAAFLCILAVRLEDRATTPATDTQNQT